MLKEWLSDQKHIPYKRYDKIIQNVYPIKIWQNYQKRIPYKNLTKLSKKYTLWNIWQKTQKYGIFDKVNRHVYLMEDMTQ